MLRQLCSVTAAAAGAHLPPDDFAQQWRVGPADGGDDDPAGVHLLPAADGLALFAARHQLPVVSEAAP